MVVLADPSLDLPLRPWMIKSPRATVFDVELEALAGLLDLSTLDELATLVLFESVVAVSRDYGGALCSRAWPLLTKGSGCKSTR